MELAPIRNKRADKGIFIVAGKTVKGKQVRRQLLKKIKVV